MTIVMEDLPISDMDVNGNTTAPPPEEPLVIFPWVDFAFFCTTTVLIIALNGTVLILLAKIGPKKLRKSVHNVQILSLSVSDIMVGVTLIPMQISFYSGQMTHMECAVRCGVFMVAFMASMLHVCIICIDRWWVIYFKVTQTKTQFLPRCILLISSTWTLAFVIEFIPLVLWRDTKTNVTCSISTIFGDFFNEAFAYLACTHTSVLVCVTIFYCLIIISIMKRRSKVNHMNQESVNLSLSNSIVSGSTSFNGNAVKGTGEVARLPNFHLPNFKALNRKDEVASTSARKPSNVSSTYSNVAIRKSDARQRRALKTIGLIVTIHLLCVGPLIIMLFVEVVSSGRASLTWHHAMFCIACLSSAGNPLLYAFRVPEVRRMIGLTKNRAQDQDIVQQN